MNNETAKETKIEQNARMEKALGESKEFAKELEGFITGEKSMSDFNPDIYISKFVSMIREMTDKELYNYTLFVEKKGRESGFKKGLTHGLIIGLGVAALAVFLLAIVL